MYAVRVRRYARHKNIASAYTEKTACSAYAGNNASPICILISERCCWNRWKFRGTPGHLLPKHVLHALPFFATLLHFILALPLPLILPPLWKTIYFVFFPAFTAGSLWCWKGVSRVKFQPVARPRAFVEIIAARDAILIRVNGFGVIAFCRVVITWFLDGKFRFGTNVVFGRSSRVISGIVRRHISLENICFRGFSRVIWVSAF